MQPSRLPGVLAEHGEAIAAELALYAMTLRGTRFATMPADEATAQMRAFVDALAEGTASGAVEAAGSTLAVRIRVAGLRLPELQQALARLRAVIVPRVVGACEGDEHAAATEVAALDQHIAALMVSFGRSYLHTTSEELRRVLHEQRTALAAVKDQTQRDRLTGLFNHAHFYVTLGTECERARRYGRDLAVVLLSIDGLPAINDHYGRREGDRVLATIAGALVDAVRQPDVIARWGGREFAAMLPETDLDAAAVVAQKLLATAARAVGLDVDAGFPLSAGVAQFRRHGDDASDLMWSADRALRAAIAAGGGVRRPDDAEQPQTNGRASA